MQEVGIRLQIIITIMMIINMQWHFRYSVYLHNRRSLLGVGPSPKNNTRVPSLGQLITTVEEKIETNIGWKDLL